MTEHAETADAERGEREEPPAPVPTRPRAQERGKMRRRLRRQSEVREALLLDLGALVFELHRQGRREPELLQAKAAELSSVDDEVRALAAALDENLGLVSLAAAGISATCDECGTVLAADARFCHHCGHAAAPGLARPAEPAAEEGASQPAAAPEPEPEPEVAAEPEPEPIVEPEPEPEPVVEPEPEPVVEPEPEPVVESEPTGDEPEPRAPWLTEPDDPVPNEPETPAQVTAEFDAAPWLAAADHEPEPDSPAEEPPAPHRAPRVIRREQGRVERFLRGGRPRE